MKPKEWELEAYDYELPQELIAQHPAAERDASRLLRLDRECRTISHHRFPEIIDLLPESSCIVLNNTRILPAKLRGRRRSGAEIEVLLVVEKAPGTWSALVRKAKRIRPNEVLEFCEGNIRAQALERDKEGNWLLRFEEAESLSQQLERYGLPPLPPYILRKASDDEKNRKDQERYQTCYARIPGAIAAPTAGLHFTPGLIDQLREKGIRIFELTLHVGLGTFSAVESRDIRKHRMHAEFFNIEPSELKLLRELKAGGRKVVAVGTTVVRVLETLARGRYRRHSGWTDIFIHPPCTFRMVDGMLTNFHLPRSTLIMLVSAFCGREAIMKAYSSAIQERYRFFSYGDCMLIL